MSDEGLALAIFEWLRHESSLPSHYGASAGVGILRGLEAVRIDGTYDLVALAAHVKNLLVKAAEDGR